MDGIRMVLVGPHAGKNIELGGFIFEDGALILPARGSGHAMSILTRYYNAFPEGSLEGKAAQEAWENARAAKSSAGASPSASAENVERLRAELAYARRERAELEERLARAEASKAKPAAEVPAETPQGDAPKGGKRKAPAE